MLFALGVFAWCFVGGLTHLYIIRPHFLRGPGGFSQLGSEIPRWLSLTLWPLLLAFIVLDCAAEYDERRTIRKQRRNG